MFCSSCGKTLQPGELRCNFCGVPIGESRFMGGPYTSAQPKILPGSLLQGSGRAYTRTTYSGLDADAGEADERTTYRPVYEGASVPESIREDVRAAVNGEDQPAPEIPEEVVEAVDRIVEEEFGEDQPALDIEGFDLSDIRSRPIESKGQSGISPDVTEYVQKKEAERERKAEKKQARAAEAAARAAGTQPQDVFSENYDEEAEEEEIEERARFSGKAMQWIKIAAALAVLAAIIVGIVLWVQHVSDRTQGAPVEDVTLDLYNAGLETITAHADSAHVQTLLDRYATDGILTLQTQLEADAAEIRGLMPEEPMLNDSIFIGALESIQSNIGNAVTMDALALAQPAQDSLETSERRWQVIGSAIEQLRQAKTITEVQAVTNGEKITIQTAAPTPTPTPVAYSALTRGDKSEEVRQMQERLWQLGFLQDDRDGNFGGNTYTAVKTFQQAAGLDVTGIADSRTLALLYSDDAPSRQVAQPEATPAPQETPQPGTEDGTSN